MKTLAITVLFALWAGAAAAQTLDEWGEVGDWDVLIDPTAGDGCLAQKSFEDGTIVQIGAAPEMAGGFFAAYNADWTDIEEGATGTLNFDFGEARFAGDAVGVILNETPGGYAFFDNPAFTSEFGKRQSVTVSGDGEKAVQIDLTGTTKAIEAVLTCQEEQPKPDAK